MAHPVRTTLRVLVFGLAVIVIVAMVTGNYAALATVVGAITANVWPPVFALSQAFADWFVSIFIPNR